MVALLVPYASDLYFTRIDFCPNDFRSLTCRTIRNIVQNLHEK